MSGVSGMLCMGTLTGHREGQAQPYRDVNVKPKLCCTAALSKILHYIDVARRVQTDQHIVQSTLLVPSSPDMGHTFILSHFRGPLAQDVVQTCTHLNLICRALALSWMWCSLALHQFAQDVANLHLHNMWHTYT